MLEAQLQIELSMNADCHEPHEPQTIVTAWSTASIAPQRKDHDPPTYPN